MNPELEKGIGIEKEHTNNKEVAKQIAIDHLNERKDYYTKLEKCMGKEAFEQAFIRGFSKEMLEESK